MKNNNWNVIDEKKFKQKITNVFQQVSNALTKTLGPYGSTTIIEKYGECHITKDGWQVLKNIKFDNSIDNNILMLLLRISAQVVIKVGDGSTSAIVAANAFLKELENNKDYIKGMRPKDFIENLNDCVEYLVEEIYKNSKTVDKDTFSDIYSLAYIATNGDDRISEIIQDIYVKTKNPSIEYIKSKTNVTSYEIIEGYRANITYLDNIFTTNDSGTCVVDNPIILMFDHKIDIEKALPIISEAAVKGAAERRRVVVIAPNYDKFLLDYIRKNITIEYKATGSSTVVYARATLINNISYELYNDFAIMCGAQVISEQFIDEIKPENVVDYIGTVGNMIISEKTTFIQGFNNRNMNLYEKAVEDATAKYNKLLEENQKRGIVDIKLNEVKQRMTKLYGNMGVIHVGGFSELEKTANYDLVEDAIKACESAYKHGYNIGGSLIIPYIIGKMTKTENYNKMYDIIYSAFITVFNTILRNKYYDLTDTSFNYIIDDCIKKEEPICYDLTTDMYSSDIINSCETDIEILKATASIISLLMSSNQYISINPEE